MSNKSAFVDNKVKENDSLINQKIEGYVFDIQRFSLRDGPGIRTLVFLKGCPLRCAWCDNPESQSLSPEIGEFPKRCIGCGSCINVCPERAITEDNWQINRSLCTNCGKCAEVCPSGARKISGARKSVEDIVEEVEKDRLFYENSGGGVTLSGGEPLMQPAFSREILRICKKRGIHTAMETCGHAPWSEFEKILSFLDLVLFDIKHTNPEKHKEATGESNQLIFENFTHLAHLKTPVIIRIPLIPGYNDTIENVGSIIKLLEAYRRLRKIDLLPYHELGANKYKRFGKRYTFEVANSLPEKRAQEIKRMFESRGFEVRIGG